MKTIKEWLEQLPEPIRSKALDNANKDNLHTRQLNLWHTIAGAFFWEETSEGHDYWRKVSQGINPETGGKLILKNFETLEAKRDELDKEIEELKNSTQTVYCEAYLEPPYKEIQIAYYSSSDMRNEYSAHSPTTALFELPFRKVDGKWEAAFEIAPK